MEFVIVTLLVGGLVAGFIRLRRSRGNVMEYHDIETPRVDRTRRGGDGGGDSGGRASG